MYPFVSGGLDQLALDVGHDDYYGTARAVDVRDSAAARARRGICSVTLDAAQDVEATFAPIARPKIVVRGKGKVVSSRRPSGAATLRAIPAKGYRFVSSAGACRGRHTWTVQPGAPALVRATFARRR